MHDEPAWLSLVGRAKERKLVQWALAYLAAGWIALQVLGLVQQPWHLSDSFLQASQIVLGVGFFLTVVLGWYHGEKGQQRVTVPEALIIFGIVTITAWLLTTLAR